MVGAVELVLLKPEGLSQSALKSPVEKHCVFQTRDEKEPSKFMRGINFNIYEKGSVNM